MAITWGQHEYTSPAGIPSPALTGISTAHSKEIGLGTNQPDKEDPVIMRQNQSSYPCLCLSKACDLCS